MSVALFLQLVISGLTMGAIYALVAIGYNVVFATTQIINFAQGQLVMLGAVGGLAIIQRVGGHPLWSLPLAAAGGAVIGAVVERLAYRPLQDNHAGKAIGWIITTLALGIIIENAAMLHWGSEPLRFPPFVAERTFNVGGAIFDTSHLFVFVTAIVLALLVERLLNRTQLGKAFKATSWNRETAEYMGINTRAVIVACFALGGALAAAAGFLAGPLTFASTTMGLFYGLKGFGAAILGGLGSGRGAIVAGLTLGVVENVIGGGLIPAGYRDAVAFAFLIVVLTFRPEGLYGEYTEKKV